jgi:hypothetical protein
MFSPTNCEQNKEEYYLLAAERKYAKEKTHLAVQVSLIKVFTEWYGTF